MTKKVFVELSDMLITSMFLEQDGYDVVSDRRNADLICFAGGEDVCPSLYGHPKHKTTRCSEDRDNISRDLYFFALDNNIPMVGICRGAQFLNVMNHGKLYQHVSEHAIGGTHKAYLNYPYLITEPVVEVTSTHHQMMIPHKDGEVLLTASIAPYRITWVGSSDGFWGDPFKEMPDTEAVLYEKTKSLCFQPHPEYFNPVMYKEYECRKVFFQFLRRIF